MSDYYQILGVSRQADVTEIKKAFRRAARKYHPDVSKEADAETKFKQVQEAYDVLKDKKKRQLYDQFGEHWQQAKTAQDQGFNPGASGFGSSGQGAHFEFNAGDMFEQIFKGGGFSGFGGQARQGQSHRQKGEDIEYTVTIPLEASYHGGEHSIRVNSAKYGRKSLNLKIPKGITEGQKIRLSGHGQASVAGGKAGDLYLTIAFQPSAFYKVEAADVYLDLPISPWEAAMGAKIKVPTLGGSVEVNIPAGSKSGQKLRLKGRGLPAKQVGDQYCTLQIMTPKASTNALRDLYKQLAIQSDFKPREHFNVE